MFRLERVKNEEELIATIKDLANRFKYKKGHQELARILCGLVKRVILKRLQIDAKQFEAVHELEEFGAMLENVIPNMIERVKKENTNEIAKKMLDLNETIDKIIQFTGLSRQDILALKTKNANT
ncbi:MAG: hypothetical protein IJS54_06315 [Desulfovibrio sp.]|nr:hypothetical protein [Desulfovibrio sp.]